MKEFHGCYPTMITPFTEDGRVDFNAVEGLVEWYIAHGADGIFAVCQSSEMFFLSDEEKINIAKTVAERADGRVKVVASGHTDDSIEKQIDMLGRISETGVDAVVMSACGELEQLGHKFFFDPWEAVLRRQKDVLCLPQCCYRRRSRLF